MTSPFIPCSFTYGDAPQGGVVMPMIIAPRAPSNTIDKQYDAGYWWLAISPGSTGAMYYQAGNIGGLPNWTLITQSNAGSFTSLAVTGTTTINTSGAAVTSIGTGGTGAVNIGNATGGTAVTGNETVTGNITTTAGNVVINGAAKQLQVHGGAVTDFIGTGTLTAGVTTPAILNTNIAATDRIFLQRISPGASTAVGELTYSISAGASFTVTSATPGTPGTPLAGDVSTFAYFIVRQV